MGANWSMDRFRALRRDIDTSYIALLRRVAPQLAECVMHASRADERLYLGSTRNFFRTAHGPGWVLLGDAHYKKDPVPRKASPTPSATQSASPTPSITASRGDAIYRRPWRRMQGRAWSGRCRFTSLPAKWLPLLPHRPTCAHSIPRFKATRRPSTASSGSSRKRHHPRTFSRRRTCNVSSHVRRPRHTETLHQETRGQTRRMAARRILCIPH